MEKDPNMSTEEVWIVWDSDMRWIDSIWSTKEFAEKRVSLYLEPFKESDPAQYYHLQAIYDVHSYSIEDKLKEE